MLSFFTRLRCVAALFILLTAAAFAAPNAPTALATSNLKATSFTLTWSAATGGVGGIAGYDIYQNGTLIGSTTTARTFVVAGLVPLTDYGMTVSARDGAGGVSPQSGVLSVATPADTTVPTRPADLAATAITTTSCTLSWTGSTDNVGVTGYLIYRSGVQIGSSSGTSFDVVGLVPDTSNSLTVRATDAAGNLSAASVALAVRTLALPPSSPTGLAATALKATSFTLSWAASSGGTGGIAGYDIYQNGALIGSTTTARTLAVSGLAPTTEYSMTVTARDSAGNISPASAVLEVVTPADTTIPTRPADLAATAVTTTSFTLTWTDSTDNVGVTGYNIYRSGVLLGTTPATTYEVTGLIPDSTNSITVRATDAAGNLSSASIALSVRMVALPPSAPTGLATTNLKPASFKLTWAAASGGTGGIVGYEVYLNGSLVGSPTTRALAITGLVPTTAYTMTVVSRDSVGNLSPPSDPLIVTPPTDTTKPTVPKGLSAADVTPTSFTLTWTASTDNVGVTGYDVYRNNVLIGSTPNTSFNVTGLAASTLSSMRLKAKDAAGNISGFSVILAVTTSAPPNVPPAIALTAPADGSAFTLPFTLTLSASATDSDGSIAKVEFFDNGTLLGETTAPDQSGVWLLTLSAPLSSGSHSLTARATDNRNATTDSAPVAITVNHPNSSPTVVLNASAAGTAPAFFVLSAEATDSDGVITKVEFYEGSNLLGEVLAPSTLPSTFAFPVALYSVGTYTLTAVATDNSGAQSNSAPVVINVTSGAATLPFLANFESAEGFQLGPLSGQLSWIATNGVTVAPSTTPTPNSQQELSIPAAQPTEIFSHDFSAEGISPVFVDFRTRPVAGVDPASAIVFSTPAAQVAFVGMASPAALWIFGGNGVGWHASGKMVAIEANGRTPDWLRLTTREDYLTKKWDLYLNGQMVAADVPFADPTAAALTDFSVNGHATAASSFDSFYAGPENPLFADINHNGLDDTWETTHGLSLATDNRSLSPTGNGVTVLQAYLADTDPNDFYNGATPTLSIVSGDNQTGTVGQFNAEPFVVSVKNAAGTPLTNAPITFTVQSGGGQLALTGTGAPALSSTVNLTTDGYGNAQVYFQQPADAEVSSLINVSAKASKVTFHTQSSAGSASITPLYQADFEASEGYEAGSINNQNGWRLYAGSAIVAEANFFSGTRSLSIEPKSVVHLGFPTFPELSIGFVDLYIRPAVDAYRPNSTCITMSGPVLTFVQHDGVGEVVTIHDNDGLVYEPTGWTFPLAASQASNWLHVTFRIDSNRMIYDLYIDGTLVAAGVSYVSYSIERLEILSGTGIATSFDALAVFAHNPLFVDSDDDGMSDTWEAAHGLNRTLDDRDQDLDGDGLTNFKEFQIGTDPRLVDTDGDGLPDKWEVDYGYDPLHAESPTLLGSDADLDGLTLLGEAGAGTDPNNSDTDGDGLPDAVEIALGLDPRSGADAAEDADGDGISNLDEYLAGTNAKDFFNGETPEIVSLAGPEGDLGPGGELRVHVTRPDGTPYRNAPVKIELVEGNSRVTLSQSDTQLHTSVEARTDADGIARVYVRTPRP